MCLILIAWQIHPEYPLIIAANRDEFFNRPTAHLAAWKEAPDIFAGRDLQAGGTWLGITKAGRFAAITNVREPAMAQGPCSRGLLTHNFLLGNTKPEIYTSQIDGKLFSGFNLLVGDKSTLFYTSNRAGSPQPLPPGIYGISNEQLDTPWPKLISAKTHFKQAINKLPDTQDCFALLANDEIAPDDQLPRTGVPLELERTLSAIVVRSPNYGTRASTVILRSNSDALKIIERSFDVNGQVSEASFHLNN